MPILRQGELDIISHSVQQTERLGARLGKLVQPGDVIALSGDMGAGKTVFATGIGKGFGTLSTITSPTYNLVHEHRRAADDVTLYHLDCYRLKSAMDAESIGFDDILDDPQGIVVIEWAERIEDLLPEHYLWIELRVTENTRRTFSLEADGTRYETLIRQFRESAFGA